MRTIVAFLVLSVTASAQPASEVDRLEKRIADHSDNAGDRQGLVRAVSFQGGVAAEKARPIRRTQILWLIEHQPSAKVFDEPFMQLWPRGRLADPEGFAQAGQLWKRQASAPDASTKTIANAAVFFKIPDAAEGYAILDAAESAHPRDSDLARARGILDAASILGVAGINDANFPRYTTTAARRETPAARNALKEVESSQDANLVGGAGEFLGRGGSFFVIPFNVTFGDDDMQSLAEKWLRRAHSLAPSVDTWNSALSNVIRSRSQRTNDATEKLRLLVEACTLLPDVQKLNLRPEIALAEFEASDDASAERDARELLASPRGIYDYHIGQTVLGRIALVNGNQAEAKRRLLESVKPPASIKNPVIQPNMKLAQEILDTGDRDTVLQFLEAARAVWTYDQGRLDHMINFVKRSSSPLDLQQMAGPIPGIDFRNRPSPDFEAKDRDGKTWTRDQLSGKVVALVFGNDKLAANFSAPGVELFRAAASREDPLARRFEIESDPTLVVLDKQGRVAAYLPGKSNEAAWRREVEYAASGIANPQAISVGIPEPKPAAPIEGNKATVSWEPVDNAESYVVEWDSHDEKGWIFDREGTVRVIPTRDTSVSLDLIGFTRIRWRVFAVPRGGQPGKESSWHEIEGSSVTKIYK